MAKFTTVFFIIALLFCSTLTYASARPNPISVYPEDISVKVSLNLILLYTCIQYRALDIVLYLHIVT